MEKQNLEQLIEEVKQIKFANPQKRQSGTIRNSRYVIENDLSINGLTNYTNGINLVPTTQNKYLANMFVISCGKNSENNTFTKKYIK